MSIRVSRMIDSPCHGCSERNIGCHSKCDLYAEYRQKIDDVNKGYLMQTSGERKAKELLIESIQKQKRREYRKGK